MHICGFVQKYVLLFTAISLLTTKAAVDLCANSHLQSIVTSTQAIS